MERLDSMIAFVKIAELASFSAAANSLGVSASALSRVITRLEARLKVSLLNRTTRQVALTDLGKEFLEHCKLVLTQADAAEAAMLERSTEVQGRLRVHVPVVFGRLTVIPNLAKFYQRYPDLNLDIVFSDDPLDLGEQGHDLSVWIGPLPENRIRHRVLAKTYRVTCASPEYLQRYGNLTSIGDLVRHRCISTTGWNHRLNWQFKSNAELKRLNLSPFLQVNSGDGLREAALCGLGIIQSSSYLVSEDLREGRLVPVLKSEIVDGDAISVIYPHRKYPSATVTAFVEFLVAAVVAQKKLTSIDC
jgi:LysR family transcriptional regulator for bpeEF and oprC